MKRPVKIPTTLHKLVPWLVLVFLLASTYARFFVAPYPGFLFSPMGYIDGDYANSNPQGTLQLGDKILQIGELTWEKYMSDVRQTFFAGARPGDTGLVRVERDGQPVDVLWHYPGFNVPEFLDRLEGQWWMGFVFWLFGTLAFLSLRPKDRTWQLMIAAYYLTAIWLMAGTLSAWAIWHSAVIMRMVTWLYMPVYLHLHWIFPKPLGVLLRRLGQFVYGLAGLMAIFEWFQLLPTPTYFLAFFITFLGSLGLLLAHAVRQPGERRRIGLLVVLIGAGILPSLLMAASGALGNLERAYLIAMFGLPIIPAAYLYVAFQRRLRGWELRANRAIVFFLFVILLIIISVVAMFVFNALSLAPQDLLVVSFILTILIGLGTARFYSDFQSWVEASLLKIPLVTSRLTEIYAERITMSLEISQLVQLLEVEILPSLLVRQSALLRLDEQQHNAIIYTARLAEADTLPLANDRVLLAESGVYRPIYAEEEPGRPWPWVRLALPLRLGDQLMGLWLLGRRDPDDYYAQNEIEMLKSLANQTAVALSNILQTERLQSLYQANVGREEAERSRLARELHDDVLGQMALLAMSTSGQGPNERFDQAYQSATEHVRQVINQLRPAMLNYGLHAALGELIDDVLELASEEVDIRLEVPPSDCHYPLEVEAYLYRIVQQACQNAVQHGKPHCIRITGQLDAAQINLSIEDDGVGFAAGEALDLAEMLAQKHFGLAGMYERAAAIGARLTIQSAPLGGAQVKVEWNGSTV